MNARVEADPGLNQTYDSRRALPQVPSRVVLEFGDAISGI
jgi:hypothetical protein